MVGEQFEIEAGTEDVLADETGGTRLVQGRLEALVALPDLAVDVVVPALDAHGEGGDGHAFDHLMRVVAQQIAILEGARFALVGVAADVLRSLIGLGHEAPLEAGGEAGAAAAAQRGLFHLSDDSIGRQLLVQNLFQRLVAATLDVVGQVPGLISAGRIDAGGKDGHDAHDFCSRNSANNLSMASVVM